MHGGMEVMDKIKLHPSGKEYKAWKKNFNIMKEKTVVGNTTFSASTKEKLDKSIKTTKERLKGLGMNLEEVK